VGQHAPVKNMPLHQHSPVLGVKVIGLVVALALLGTACTDDGTAKASQPAANPCAPEDNEKPAKALARCAENSVGYVSNVVGTGTGVVIEADGDTYVLTNLHVVDPYSTADVTFGSETLENLEVAGVDERSDIALLGPLGKDAPPALPIGRGSKLGTGDDVFLVGYPGESGGTNRDKPEDLEATVSSGIVSRLRTVKEFGQRFIQTDASISGGQSGGPLFDSTGQLVGISGLSFAEEFALALIGEDVQNSVDDIVAGKSGKDYLSVPQRDGDPTGLEAETAGTLKFADAADTQFLFLPAADDKRTLKLSITNPDAVLNVSTLAEGKTLAVSASRLDVEQEIQRRVAERQGGSPDDLPDITAGGLDKKLTKAEVSPGNFEVEVPADEALEVTIDVPLIDVAAEVSWTSDLPLLTLTQQRPEQPLQLGESVDWVFNPYDAQADFLVDLTEGQSVEIYARTAAGDVAFDFIRPDVVLDAVTLLLGEADGIESIDDTDDGIYGTDARESFDVEETGTYRIRLYSNDGVTSLARISVTDCEDSSAECR